jgi:predicted phage terminase large subunit-like protein
LDDLHKAQEAKRSAVSRIAVQDWFKGTIETRLNDQNTPIIVIGQRLHEDDIAGWLLAGGNGEEWELINLPAIIHGDALWPDKMSLAELRRIEASKPYEFASQYMQHPVPIGGGMFKDAWMQQRYRALPAFSRILQSWDTAQKDKRDRNDPSVCTTWGMTANGYYLLDVSRRWMEYPDLLQCVKDQAAKWRPSTILIEDKSSGISLIQDLRRTTRLPIIAVDPKGRDKIDRAEAVTGLFESGNVYLPESAEWVADYIAELTVFPMGGHDDQVDSTSQALEYMGANAGRGYATAGSRAH